MRSKLISVSVQEARYSALLEMMATDMETNASAFISGLIAKEYLRRTEAKDKRPVGRPRKEDNEEELADENAPRTMRNPYPEYVLPKDASKLVNQYDIDIIEERMRLHKAQNA